jgi:hypothetical protein
MVVLQVGLEVRGQLVDAVGEQRDLDLGRPGVAGAARIGLDDLGLVKGGCGHDSRFPVE